MPAEGCCFNYVQAGPVVYGDDDNFVKLAAVSIWETRQTELAKELSPVPAGYPRYGNTVAGTPSDWTWLRIARWERNQQVLYQAFTSQDGNELGGRRHLDALDERTTDRPGIDGRLRLHRQLRLRPDLSIADRELDEEVTGRSIRAGACRRQSALGQSVGQAQPKLANVDLE